MAEESKAEGVPALIHGFMESQREAFARITGIPKDKLVAQWDGRNVQIQILMPIKVDKPRICRRVYLVEKS